MLQYARASYFLISSHKPQQKRIKVALLGLSSWLRHEFMAFPPYWQVPYLRALKQDHHTTNLGGFLGNKVIKNQTKGSARDTHLKDGFPYNV